MQNIAQPRGDLGALGHQPPAALRPPGDIEGDDEQMMAPSRAYPMQGPDIAGMAEDEGRRQQTFRQQSAGAIEIRQDRLEQAGPLRQARLDAGPVLGGDQEGQQLHRPGARRGTLGAEDVVGDAVAQDPLVHLVPAAVQLGGQVLPWRQGREEVGEARPSGSERSVVRAQFVPGIGGRWGGYPDERVIDQSLGLRLRLPGTEHRPPGWGR